MRLFEAEELSSPLLEVKKQYDHEEITPLQDKRTTFRTDILAEKCT